MKRITIGVNTLHLASGDTLDSITYLASLVEDFSSDIIHNHTKTSDYYSDVFNYDFIASDYVYVKILATIRKEDGTTYTSTLSLDKINKDTDAVTDLISAYSSEVTTTGLASSGFSEVKVDVVPPKFFFGTAAVRSVEYNIYDTSYNLIQKFIKTSGDIYTNTLDLSKYKSYGVVVVEVVFNYDVSVYQPPSRCTIVLSSNTVSNFNIDKTYLVKGVDNTIYVKYFKELLTGVKYMLVNSLSNDVLYINNDSSLTITIPSSAIDGETEVTLIITCTGDRYGLVQNKFKLPIVEGWVWKQ